jgi:hypothetical protein
MRFIANHKKMIKKIAIEAIAMSKVESNSMSHLHPLRLSQIRNLSKYSLLISG